MGGFHLCRHPSTSCLKTNGIGSSQIFSGWQVHISIWDPKDSVGVLQTLWASIYLVQTSCTMPAFLRASVKSRPHLSSRLSSDFTAHTKELDTLQTGARSLPRRVLIVLNNGLQSLSSFMQPESLTTRVAKKLFLH